MPDGLGLVLCIAAFWALLHAFAYRLRTRQRGLQRVSLDKLTASVQSARFPGLESTLGPPLCLRFSYTPPVARSLATKPKRPPAVVGRWAQHCYSLGAWLALVAFLCLPIAFAKSLYRGMRHAAHASASPILGSRVRSRSGTALSRPCGSDMQQLNRRQTRRSSCLDSRCLCQKPRSCSWRASSAWSGTKPAML